MGLLYYLPGESRNIGPEKLTTLGIAGVFEAPPTPCEVLGGPDGSAGVVIADDRQVNAVGYYPDRQRWQEFGRLWVGVETDRATLPAELLRRRSLPGHLVRLADGQDWLIPVARAMVETPEGLRPGMNLPTRPKLGADGKWNRADLLPEYAELWRVACGWWDSVINSGDRNPSQSDPVDSKSVVFDFDDVMDAACVALSANYRISREGVSLLNLLTDAIAGEVLFALVDWPTLEKLSKKKPDAAA